MARGIRDEDRDDDKHTIDDAEAIGETDKALRVRTKEHGDVWVPKSVIHDDSEVFEKGGDGALIVKAWFARKEGWI